MNGDCGRMNGGVQDSSNPPKSLVMLPMIKNAVAALLATFAFAALPTAAHARLQCVTYARQISDVQISGNARDWWSNAAGTYDRSQQPKAGAVLAFSGTRAMPYGHVAVVRKVVDDRHILIDHANWSGPGMVEKGVMAVDVSPAGDWSEVRVWYAPTKSVGLRASPAHGFIYPRSTTVASAASETKQG